LSRFGSQKAFASNGLIAEAADYLVGTPIIASLVLVGTVELLRVLRLPAFAQILVAAAILSAINGVSWRPFALIVAPLFLLSAYAYLRWRRESWLVALGYVILVHFLSSLVPALNVLVTHSHNA
jgi:hypothetical protein